MVTPSDQRPRSNLFLGLNARAAKRILAIAFEDAALPFAEDDAREIVENATGLDRTAMMLRGTELLEPDASALIQAHMTRRLAGEPVDHILGWREFFGRRFKISKDVLSPRADTETLIRGALERLPSQVPLRVLDLGTGSGAIGLTLLAERPHANLLATDVSDAALRTARQNMENLDLSARATFAQGGWWKAVPDVAVFDMILSNPPYITDAAMTALEPEVLQFDPDLALRGGADGLDAYREILSQAKSHLTAKGWLGFEIGYDQGAALMTLMSEAGWNNISLDKDLGGQDRAVWGQRP